MIRVSAAMKAALRSPDRKTAILVEVEWPTGTVRMWNGVGLLSWAGVDYRGMGVLGSIKGIEMTGQVGIQQIEMAVSGIPGDVEIDLPDTSLKGRSARIWLACLTPDEQVIADPYLLATLALDHTKWRMGDDGTSSLTIVGTAGIWQHEQPTQRAWTAEEQRRVYPDDSGFDQITSVSGKALKWSKT